MVTKVFGRDFDSSGGALTLRESDLGSHPDGWTVVGALQEDYYVWVNDFEASHPFFGKVWGNFESQVYADSEEGYQHFMKHHSPEAWDYWDI